LLKEFGCMCRRCGYSIVGDHRDFKYAHLGPEVQGHRAPRPIHFPEGTCEYLGHELGDNSYTFYTYEEALALLVAERMLE
jgi:hypothetical protein